MVDTAISEANALTAEIQTLLIELVVRYPFIESRAMQAIGLLAWSDPLGVDVTPAVALVADIADDIRAHRRQPASKPVRRH